MLQMSSVAEPDELCAALTTLRMRTRVDLSGQMAIHYPLGEGVASLIAPAPMKHLLSDSIAVDRVSPVWPRF